MAVKFLKYSDDACFGKKHEQLEECKNCWIKNSCYMKFRNKGK
ncbi:MAG: hypothetical protein QXU88_00650 [Candidatus Woesearchaeota archaeon]